MAWVNENETGSSNFIFPCRRKTVGTKVHTLKEEHKRFKLEGVFSVFLFHSEKFEAT